MITVIDEINKTKSIKPGNVVDITNDNIEEDIPLRAIVIQNKNCTYSLLDMYTFNVIDTYFSLQSLIKAYGLVLYSNNITITINDMKTDDEYEYKQEK